MVHRSLFFSCDFSEFNEVMTQHTLTREIILVCFFSKMAVKEVIQKEMKNVWTAFEEQTTRSLGVMKLALDRFGLSFPPDFKQYFIESSGNR